MGAGHIDVKGINFSSHYNVRDNDVEAAIMLLGTKGGYTYNVATSFLSGHAVYNYKTITLLEHG